MVAGHHNLVIAHRWRHEHVLAAARHPARQCDGGGGRLHDKCLAVLWACGGTRASSPRLNRAVSRAHVAQAASRASPLIDLAHHLCDEETSGGAATSQGEGE